MEEKTILVIGGKGKTGSRVAKRLTKLGKTIRIGSRSEKPPFDWENPETWAGALDDIVANAAIGSRIKNTNSMATEVEARIDRLEQKVDKLVGEFSER